jgi:tetratricopeptide (TPR) repeat protein
MPIYPQWVVAPPELTLTYVLKFFPWVVLFFGFWWLLKRRAQPWARTAIMGFGYFFLMIGPFTGWRAISFMRFQWTMDHFLYVPILGLIGLAMAAAADIYDRLPKNTPIWRIAAVSFAVFVVGAFTIGSHAYAEVFVDRLSYWTYTIQHNYSSWPSHNNRGNQLLENADKEGHAGYFDQANADFLDAKNEFIISLELNPVYTEAWNNLGYVLSRQGDFKGAEFCFRKALEYTPDFESAQLNLANVLRAETVQLQQQQQQQLQQQQLLQQKQAQQQAQQQQPQKKKKQGQPQPSQAAPQSQAPQPAQQ